MRYNLSVGVRERLQYPWQKTDVMGMVASDVCAAAQCPIHAQDCLAPGKNGRVDRNDDMYDFYRRFLPGKRNLWGMERLDSQVSGGRFGRRGSCGLL